MKNFYREFGKNLTKQIKDIGKGIADFDKDGVPNYKDCEPFNPKKHGVEPNILMKKRIEKLPIYVTNKAINDTNDIEEIIEEESSYPLFSKEARTHTPKIRKTVLSILKNYPDLITEIEKKRPKRIIFTSQPTPKDIKTSSKRLYGFAYNKLGRIIVIYTISSQTAKFLKKHGIPTGFRKEEDIKVEKKGVILSQAGMLRHELEHTEQYKEQKKKGRRRGTKKLKRMFTGEYEKRTGEKQAVRAQKKFVEKHIKEKKKSSFNILESIFS